MAQNSLCICFICAETFYNGDYKFVICPDCGNSIDINSYNRFIDYGLSAARYGYCCRKRYEKIYHDTGSLNTLISQEKVDNIMSFIAIAALSGIVGGVSFELVKEAKDKIYNGLKERGEYIGDDVREVIFDDDSFEIFIEYISGFYNSLDNVNTDIREAIIENMVADKCDIDYKRKPFAGSVMNRDFEKLREILIKHKITTSNNFIFMERKPLKKDFNNFWGQI